ncbi:MAG: hypothetical protein AAFV29_05410 [Myxococcota bacterium]
MNARRLMVPAWVGGLFATLLTGFSLQAEAGTVALTSATGPAKEDVVAAVEATLRKDRSLRVITLAEWQKAAKEAGLNPVKDRSRLARRLRVSRLLSAAVKRDGGAWTVSVVVYNAKGKGLKRWRAKSRKVQRLESLVRKRMMARLQSVLRTKAAPADRAKADLAGQGSVRVGVLGVKGGKRTGRRLAKLLSQSGQFKRVTNNQVESMAAKIGANVDTSRGRRKLARALKVDAWLNVRSRVRRKRYAVTARVYSGETGRLIDTLNGRGNSEPKALSGMLTLLGDLLRTSGPSNAGAVAKAAPPAGPRKSSGATPNRLVATPQPRDSDAGVSASVRDQRPITLGGRNRSPLTVALGIGLQSRDYSYNDDVFQALRPYELSGAPAITADVRWYPAGHFTDGILQHIGIDARLRYLVGVSSEDSEGNQFDTGSFDVFGSLRGRLPFGAHEAGLALGFGTHSFDVDLPEDGPALPAVNYSYLRIGADSRFSLPASLELYFGAGFRQVLSSGDVSTDVWFPNASQAGVDAQLALGWSFYDNLELRLGAEYTRYFFSLNPEVGDNPVAGGALDQYISGTFDIVWSLDG